MGNNMSDKSRNQLIKEYSYIFWDDIVNHMSFTMEAKKIDKMELSKRSGIPVKRIKKFFKSRGVNGIKMAEIPILYRALLGDDKMPVLVTTDSDPISTEDKIMESFSEDEKQNFNEKRVFSKDI